MNRILHESNNTITVDYSCFINGSNNTINIAGVLSYLVINGNNNKINVRLYFYIYIYSVIIKIAPLLKL